MVTLARLVGSNLKTEVPMLHLKFDLSGKPAVFMSNCKRYYNGLSGLSLYRNPPDQAISLGKLKEVLDLADQKYQDAIPLCQDSCRLGGGPFRPGFLA